ncbi:MAG: hypothetical protein P4L82_10100 [Ancalomicrobiaceae bacterium]|nr:hypothetical protein [Ancalomicrobiaceae bacterium]
MADTPEHGSTPDNPPANDPPAPVRPKRSLALRVGLRLLQVLATVFVLLYVLFDDLVLAWLRPLFATLGRLRLFVRLALWMRRRPPYMALVFFAVPFIVLEPFKLGGLVLLGIGHFVSGTVMLAISHLLSLLIVERIFHVTRDQLLTIGWFAWAFGYAMRTKDWAFARLKASPAWRFGVALAERLRRAFRPAANVLGRCKRAIAAGWRRLFARMRAVRD